MAETEQKRAYFRIVYPVGDRPKIMLRNETFDVIDLSEMGVRFVSRNAGRWLGVAEALQATIVFFDKEKVTVIGRVLRANDDQVILHLSRGIPLTKVMAEQRRILQSHNTLKK